MKGGGIERVLGIGVELFGEIDAALPLLHVVGLFGLRRGDHLAGDLGSLIGPLADQVGILLRLCGLEILVRGFEVVRVHGHQLVAYLDGFVGLSRLDISHLHLFVNPADGFMLGSFRLELLHQRELLGVIGRLADLLEQLSFRRFGVDRA